MSPYVVQEICRLIRMPTICSVTPPTPSWQILYLNLPRWSSVKAHRVPVVFTVVHYQDTRGEFNAEHFSSRLSVFFTNVSIKFELKPGYWRMMVAPFLDATTRPRPEFLHVHLCQIQSRGFSIRVEYTMISWVITEIISAFCCIRTSHRTLTLVDSPDTLTVSSTHSVLNQHTQ